MKPNLFPSSIGVKYNIDHSAPHMSQSLAVYVTHILPEGNPLTKFDKSQNVRLTLGLVVLYHVQT